VVLIFAFTIAPTLTVGLQPTTSVILLALCTHAIPGSA